jgi:hypothetical protein
LQGLWQAGKEEALFSLFRPFSAAAAHQVNVQKKVAALHSVRGCGSKIKEKMS